MKRNSTRLIGYQLLSNFVSLGFRCLSAFVTVCQTVDSTISYLELELVWSGGECNSVLELKLIKVLENLKNE